MNKYLGICPECNQPYIKLVLEKPSGMTMFGTGMKHGARIFYHEPVMRDGGLEGSFCIAPNEKAEAR